MNSESEGVAETAKEPSRSVLEAASWALATSLARRHPQLTIRRDESGGGGLYDCLGIHSEADGVHIDLNRNGRIHVHQTTDGRIPNWEPTEWWTFLSQETNEFVARLEEACRLPPVKKLPPTTRRVMTYRILAGFARLHVFGPPVDISMSTVDGYTNVPSEWLGEYPQVERLIATQPYDFWRAKSHETELVIETEAALVHRRDGPTISLPEMYDHHGRNFGRLFGAVLDSS